MLGANAVGETWGYQEISVSIDDEALLDPINGTQKFMINMNDIHKTNPCFVGP